MAQGHPDRDWVPSTLRVPTSIATPAAMTAPSGAGSRCYTAYISYRPRMAPARALRRSVTTSSLVVRAGPGVDYTDWRGQESELSRAPHEVAQYEHF